MHKCLKCGKIFERLTDAMLKGCPDCGGKLFLYLRPGEELSAAELVKRIEVDEPGPVELEQIESLRILSPGVYELNLNALLERKEIVMRIKKDGSYVVPLSALFKRKGKQ